MNRTFRRSAVGACLALAALSSDALAGRGGGGRGGYGGGHRGGGYGGQMGGSSMGHSPSFSSPRSPSGGESQYGNRNDSGNNANHSNAGAAAAGAGYSNRNQPSNHNAGAAAAGAGYSNRNNNNSNLPYGGAGAAGAGYANRNNNDSRLPYGGAGAVGAGYANRNNSNLPNNGAGAVGAAAGANYANRNNRYSNAGAAALGYGAGAGRWNGNNSGAWGMGGSGMSNVGAWGTGSPMYGWGYSGYNNPYAGGGGGQQVNVNVPQQGAAPSQSPAYNYAQPISTTSAAPEPAAADQAVSAFNQSRDAFKAGDYDLALQFDRQALAQTPDDTTMHEFLALILFAQGKYDQAAAPLYAVMSVGPGWDWTTLSGMYPDVDTYTGQLRKLESYVKANPNSAHARFVLAYQYLCEGHDENAVKQLRAAVKLQPADTLSAQLVAQFQPAGAPRPTPAPADSVAAPGAEGKLAGKWSAAPAPGAKVALAINDDGGFTWAASGPGRPTSTIAGSSALADGVLTLAAKGEKDGDLAGNVVWKDADHFTFRLVGAPPQDPGLRFAR